MNAKEALKYMEGLIDEQEKTIYRFESILIPRYEKEKQILEEMRDQHVKLYSLLQKEERGEDISKDEIYEAVPEQFR